MKSYSSKNNLKIHERIHSGERPYKCKTCFKNFISSTSLQKHENLHTGERPHQCQTCFKGFMEKGKLKNHMKVHSKDKGFECKLCFRRFLSSRNLKSSAWGGLQFFGLGRASVQTIGLGPSQAFNDFNFFGFRLFGLCLERAFGLKLLHIF